MFSRHSPGASLSRWFSNNPRRHSRHSGIDRIMDAKRGYSRRLFVEPLEDRRMMAAVTVSNSNDVVNGNVASIANLIASPGGDGISLREAIQAANTDAIADAIEFNAGLNGAQILLNVAQGDLDITQPLSIDATALPSGLTINGNDPSAANFNGIRIFNIDDGSVSQITVMLGGLTLTGGDVMGVGGAISSQENLTIENSLITGNRSFGDGGGIEQFSGSLTIESSTISNNYSAFNAGGIGVGGDATFMLTDSTVSGNRADYAGGITLSNNTATITSSTISGNIASADGGGMFINYGTTTITNSTISGNTTTAGGGGLAGRWRASDSLSVLYSTITRNISDSDTNGSGSGGGMFLRNALAANGAVTLKNSIIAGNTDFTSVAPDIDNTTAPTHPTLNTTFTLVGNNKGSGLAAGALIGTPAAPINPLLAALTNNGGPTRTHAILAGSPAINMGDPAAMAGIADVPMFDQRGTPFSRVAGGRTDIGAFELVPPPTQPTMALLPSSDTGMFNNDRVTNKMQPAFGGVGPAGLPVYVFAQLNDAMGSPLGEPFIVGIGVVGSDGSDGIFGNGLGVWEVTVESLADGKYNFFARFDEPVDGPGGLTDAVADTPQTFMFTGPTSIPDGPNGVATASIIVPATPPLFVADLSVTVNITHPNVGDLTLTLISPSGTPILLANQRGGAGDNYTNTVFDDAAATSIAAGVAPFTGTFRPEEPLSTLFGEAANGTWRLFVTDNVDNDLTGQIVNWSLSIASPIMVVIDTVEPNTPFLDLLDDTGRNNNDNITKDNTPNVSMTTTDPNIALARLLFTDNLKFRIFDRYQSTIGVPAPEVLIYDSALDPMADAFMTAGDMLTAATQLTKILPFLTPLSPAITAGALSDGVHNLKLEVEDRAGNISHDFLFQIVVDTVTPRVSFGLPTVALANQTDGLNASSDSGVTTSPATFADRITSDTTPTLWGRAEANSVVRVYVDRNADGVIDLTTDTFIGQTVATPFDGNDGFVDTNGNPLGFWELTSVVDLNQILGLPKDGLRRLLVTAEDVAGNPMPVIVQDRPVINQGVESLQIFIDTQGPQITDVTPNDPTSAQFDLFDPKPSLTGFTPLVTSLKIAFRDLPARVDQNAVNINDFLYAALQGEIALSPGNYLLVGDNVGNIPIQSIQLSNPGPTQATRNLTAVLNTSTVTVAGFVGAAIQPQVGDYVLFNNGPAAGQARRIISYNELTGQMTFDTPLLNLPAVGNSLTLTKVATAVVTLNFASPLPDDRYTLTVRDNLVDPANNKLDGESNAVQPQEDPFFPTGDGVPGGNFVARFTIDSRPEIGVYVSQDIDIDINGNFIWDPGVGPIGSDAFNVDISFTLPVQNAGGSVGLGGFNVHDLLFAGKFVRPNTTALARPFDQLAAFGFSQQLNVFRWLVDTNSDGVITLGTDILITQPTLGNFSVAGAIPVSGNFDNIGANGDEIGLYNAGKWALDTNHNFVIDGGDTFITGNLLGHPIVGNFDGNLNPDGSPRDDFAVFNNNQFFFDLNANGTWDQMMTWGFPGVLDRPVAADMDGDGIDDIGLWVPRTGGTLPREIAEWYFLISNDPTGNLRQTGTINRLNHAFTPVPFGKDIFTEFGDELSLPIVGNFDPPVTPAVGGATMPGDYDRNGRVETADKMVWYAGFGSTTNMAADGNGDGRVDTADYVVWKNNFGRIAGAGSGTGAIVGGSTEAAALANTTASVFPAPAPDVVRVGWVEDRDPTVAISPTDEAPVTAPAHRPLPASSVDDFFAQLNVRHPSQRPAIRQVIAGAAWQRDVLLLATLAETRSAALTQPGSVFAHDEDADDDLFDELLADLVPDALDLR